MFPKPRSVLVPNTYAYESEPMVKATRFREYDARWLFGKEINLMGIQALGMGLGALISELGVRQEVVTGHDLRGRAAPRHAMIDVGGLIVRDVDAMVLPDEALSENLLGLSFLSRLKRFEYTNGQMVLEQ